MWILNEISLYTRYITPVIQVYIPLIEINMSSAFGFV